MTTFSLDSESFYSKQLSIKTLGAWGYVFHPEAEHYMVTVAGSDGTRFAGAPKDAPWEHMAGGIWICHNTSYDALVRMRLIQDGVIPDLPPSAWHDTADMSCYFGYPRSLSHAVKWLLGATMSKETRDRMKGKHWHEMTPEFQAEVLKYATGDAEWTLKLWEAHGHRWPAHERELSRLTRELAWRGVRLDQERVNRGIQWMQLCAWAAEQKIPWSDLSPALSYPMLVKTCKEHGIDAPPSVAIGDEGCEYWEEKYGDKYQWVGAMRIKRRCNALLTKLQRMKSRLREDGTIPMELKYAGAYPTLRWSGDGGINFQNLPREAAFGADWWYSEAAPVIGDVVSDPDLEGVDLRACIIPRKGKKFVIADSSQIQVRCGMSLVGDTKALQLMQEGYSPYDAHALTANICTRAELPLKKKDIKRYTFAKGSRLACQFGSGHHKTLQMAPIYGLSNEFFTKPVTAAQVAAYVEYLEYLRSKLPAWWVTWEKADPEMKTMLVNAWLIVKNYRDSDKRTVAMWRSLSELLHSSVGGDMDIELPGGRIMRYYKIASKEGELSALLPEFGRMTRQKLYGAMLFNHICQGGEREVMGYYWLELDKRGYPIVLFVHDELVAEIDEDESSEPIAEVMSSAPSWWSSLPLAAEVKERDHYEK